MHMFASIRSGMVKNVQEIFKAYSNVKNFKIPDLYAEFIRMLLRVMFLIIYQS